MDSNLNAGYAGSTHARMLAHQRAQRAIGAWPAAALSPTDAVEAFLATAARTLLPIGPGPEADALRALYEGS